MSRFESDPDESRGDFIRHLAKKLRVSEDAALSYLGDWMTAVVNDGSLERSATTNDARTLHTVTPRPITK